MTILYAGSAYADGRAFVSVSGSTSSRSPRVSESINVGNGSTSSFEVPLISSSLDLTLSFFLQATGNFGYRTSQPWIEFFDSSISTTVPVFSVGTTSGALMYMKYYNGSTTIFDKPVLAYISTNIVRYDIRLKIADAGGIFKLYQGGQQVGTTSLTDTQYGSITGIDMIRLRAPCSSANHYYSGVYVTTGDGLKKKLTQLKVTSQGALNGWTGGYANVDELGSSTPDSDSIVAAANGDLTTFVMTAEQTPAHPMNLEGVIVSARCKLGTNTANLDCVTRISATNYMTSPTPVPPAAYSVVQGVFATNPNTAAAWTFAQAAAAEFGLEALT